VKDIHAKKQIRNEEGAELSASLVCLGFQSCGCGCHRLSLLPHRNGLDRR